MGRFGRKTRYQAGSLSLTSLHLNLLPPPESSPCCPRLSRCRASAACVTGPESCACACRRPCVASSRHRAAAGRVFPAFRRLYHPVTVLPPLVCSPRRASVTGFGFHSA
ncbi:hypothetical protein PIB30_001585 [Stylosanthes scabra]|uniref:Secreted protein n=1 Tax=Stylosanthes scabra TaxID=79078 RepID=A0ABU6S397_9FABA|nr:hypothetical protein [Stylosanthes scabra]